ncbi:hypothetical protein NM208_g13712 [Fusarium decemcellulare]|uniref:Uncharacterized protein n=1 Tax=Fusarium decemcellulare TaxID=57161 RepID=A0ACC1RIV6_9HYPO|nr:hypothetical protein NM208_g13712 [Fusarium decemcellulare]
MSAFPGTRGASGATYDSLPSRYDDDDNLPYDSHSPPLRYDNHSPLPRYDADSPTSRYDDDMEYRQQTQYQQQTEYQQQTGYQQQTTEYHQQTQHQQQPPYYEDPAWPQQTPREEKKVAGQDVYVFGDHQAQSPGRGEREKGDYRPIPLRWHFISALIIILAGLMGVMIYAVRSLNNTDNTATFGSSDTTSSLASSVASGAPEKRYIIVPDNRRASP